MSRRPHVPRLRRDWWLEKPMYLRYLLREVSSFFIGFYAALLCVGVWRLTMGPASWEKYVDLLTSPVMVVLQLVTLAFTLYHAVGWFNVTPQTMPLMKDGEFVPPRPIVLAQYGMWAGASLVILIAVFW